MIIFCDTNIVLEVLEERSNFDYVADILLSDDSANTFFISEGSFYTITYLLDKRMRTLGIHEPVKTERVKDALGKILNMFSITDAGERGFANTVFYSAFKDLEDGYQYEAALNCGADILLTINKKDFACVENISVTILTPKEFVSRFL